MLILMDVCKFQYVNSQDNIIEKLESEIERLKLEIFEIRSLK